MKTIKFILLFIPNLPAIIFISGYVLYNVLRHTGFVEIEMLDYKNILTEKIKCHIAKYYSSTIVVLVAVIFWSALIGFLLAKYKI